MTSSRLRLVSCLLGAFLLMIPQTGSALRPYETTDADVVDPGVVEIELGVTYGENEIEGTKEKIVGIPWVFNVGLPSVSILQDTEIVLEGTAEFIEETSEDGLDRNTRQLSDLGLFLKKVWWRGRGWQPSFGSEAGVLFPTGQGDRGVDVEALAILTWEYQEITVHTTLVGGAVHVREEVERQASNGDVVETADESHIRPAFAWGIISEYLLGRNLRFGLEYSLEKVETEPFENQVILALLWDSPWRIQFDVAGLVGLNEESDDFGVTCGLTYAWGEKE